MSSAGALFEDGRDFYGTLYGSFDRRDRELLMELVLRGKEAFARRALRNVIDHTIVGGGRSTDDA